MDLVKSSYRPVSNLSYISQLVEKAVLVQIKQHCDTHNLLPYYQSTYRGHRSCKTVLLKLTNDLLWSVERKNVTVLIALDLSMSFDTVDHSVLLTILKSNFGIHGTALDWLKNYLSPRNMKMIIGSTYFDEKDLTFSVSQGLCSEVNLFNMYSSTFSKVIDSCLNLNGFANDHSIMKEFNPNLPVEESDTIDLLVNNLAKIKIQMNSVRLKVNASKSELIIFGNNTQTCKCITSEINIEGESVQRSHLVRYLDT